MVTRFMHNYPIYLDTRVYGKECVAVQAINFANTSWEWIHTQTHLHVKIEREKKKKKKTKKETKIDLAV